MKAIDTMTETAHATRITWYGYPTPPNLCHICILNALKMRAYRRF